jgi:hypothetical protein
MDKNNFLKDLAEKLLKNLPPETIEEAAKSFKKHLDDPILQLAAVIKCTGNRDMRDPSDYPVHVLQAAWEVNTLIRTCMVPEMRTIIRDFFIEAIMKGDTDTTIFPLVDRT